MCECTDPVRQCHSGDDCRYVERARLIRKEDMLAEYERLKEQDARDEQLRMLNRKLDAIMDFLDMPCC